MATITITRVPGRVVRRACLVKSTMQWPMMGVVVSVEVVKSERRGDRREKRPGRRVDVGVVEGAVTRVFVTESHPDRERKRNVTLKVAAQAYEPLSTNIPNAHSIPSAVLAHTGRGTATQKAYQSCPDRVDLPPCHRPPDVRPATSVPTTPRFSTSIPLVNDVVSSD
ncbi:hypothetical protein BDQ12DRAFT_663898 [Crucibulum laeve]|uniref:Uncharacterized protein n=1 Tax=Crucibulum laeve TaxID=68775 RepID=A0A5C3M818_9AGAR|nr:hypothetical protein BDQ12DRAFT_663898 [Crucibulum laeve]